MSHHSPEDVGRPVVVVGRVRSRLSQEGLERLELQHVQHDQDDGGGGDEERTDADDVASCGE